MCSKMKWTSRFNWMLIHGAKHWLYEAEGAETGGKELPGTQLTAALSFGAEKGFEGEFEYR